MWARFFFNLYFWILFYYCFYKYIFLIHLIYIYIYIFDTFILLFQSLASAGSSTALDALLPLLVVVTAPTQEFPLPSLLSLLVFSAQLHLFVGTVFSTMVWRKVKLWTFSCSSSFSVSKLGLTFCTVLEFLQLVLRKCVI